MGASRLFTRADTEYISRASAVVTDYPVTAGGWVLTNDADTNQTMFGLGRSGNDLGYFQFNYQGAGNDVIRWTVVSDAVEVTIPQTTVTMSANVWHHCLGISANTASHAVYLDGGNRVEETDVVAYPSVDRTSIGVQLRIGTKAPWNGNLAHWAVWNVALDDAEVADLASGISPSVIRPSALQLYVPIFGINSPELDQSGNGNNMDLTNAPTEAFTGPPLYIPGGAHV